jgi:hypothetical protein
MVSVPPCIATPSPVLLDRQRCQVLDIVVVESGSPRSPPLRDKSARGDGKLSTAPRKFRPGSRLRNDLKSHQISTAVRARRLRGAVLSNET